MMRKPSNPKSLRLGIETIFLFIVSLFLAVLFVQKQYFFEAAFTTTNHNKNGLLSMIVLQDNEAVVSRRLSGSIIEQRQYLDVELKSVMMRDIQAIWHDPSLEAICIQLKQHNARCPHPEFIGRLSGPSLVMLEWKGYSVGNNNEIHHCGSYSNATLMSSESNEDEEDMKKYFVEILILYCQHFGVGSEMHQKSSCQQQQQSTNVQENNEWLDFDFQKMCVEKPQANRITKVGASIRISSKLENERTMAEEQGLFGNGDNVRGRWMIHAPQQAAADFRPLVTRYQPQGCRSNATEETARCQVATNMARFGDYKFEWSNGQEELMTKRIQDLEWDIALTRQRVCGDGLSVSNQKRDCILQLGEMMRNHTLIPPKKDASQAKSISIVRKPPPLEQRPSKICIVGYSHSYHMIYAMHQLNLGHHFVWAQARYPNDVDFHFVRRHIKEHNCSQFLIGVGQWPASHWGNQKDWPEGKPVPFGVYRNDIFRVLDMFHNHFSKIRVYMRSIHYNPIMEDSGKCLAGDWRTPTIVTAYTEIIREQVNNLNQKIQNRTVEHKKDPQIQFLDTRFITYPMWDSSYDWYHLSDQVAEVEALYLAATILDSKSKHLSRWASSED